MRRIILAAALGLMASGAAVTASAQSVATDRAPPAAEGPTDCEPGPDGPGANPDRDDVFCFVGWLYGPGVMETITPLGEDAPRVFTTEVVALMDAARAAADGEGVHPAFEADPVCRCQDASGLRLITMVAPDVDAGSARARVAFDFRAGTDTLDPEGVVTAELILKKEADGWRVDDIRTDDGYSFRRSLAE